MNLFELFVKIGVDDQASGAISKITQGLGAGLATAAKVGTAAVGAATTGIAALTKSAVDEFADYEQLVGGVETLFKESADTVKQYADEAFQNAGLSANEYMSTVTSFSASLLQSTGRGAQTDLEALENTLKKEYEAAKETYSDMYDERKKQLSAEYNAAKEAYDAEYAALKDALDAAVAAYSAAADSKIASIDKSNKEAIAAAKQEKKDTLAAMKAGNKKELDELKAANKKKLEELKTANTAELEAFKDTNDKKLTYQKAAIQDQVNLAEEANMISVTTLESQAEAAQLANQAIIDMSDNANKMGTDMSLIQNAYQGFAKANYTMLDNLKLGYGGTQAEMQRLIADAAKLSDTVDAQSMSFANIVKAIHVVQTEMGITGTTAKEAGETIAGSASAMQAAWKNLVTEVASGEGDVEQAFQNFAESAGTYAENLLPRIEVALGGISTLIESASGQFPTLVDKAVSGIEEKLPDLLATGGNIVGTVVGAVIDNAPKLLDTGVDILTNFANGVTENLQNGSIFNATVSIIDTAVAFLTDKDGKLTEFAGAAGEMVVALGGYIKDSASKIWDGAKEVAISFVEWFNSDEGKAEIAKAADKIQTGINTGVQNTSEKFGEIGASIVGWVSEKIENFHWDKLWTSIGNAGVATIEKIISDAESKSDKLQDWTEENVVNPFMTGFTGEEYDYDKSPQASAKRQQEAIQDMLESEYGLDKGIGGYIDYFKDALAGTLPDEYYEATERMQATMRGDYLEQGDPAWMIAQQSAAAGTATPEGESWSGIMGESFGARNVYVTQNIYSQAQTAADLMEEAQYEQQRALITERMAR